MVVHRDSIDVVKKGERITVVKKERTSMWQRSLMSDSGNRNVVKEYGEFTIPKG